MGVFVSMTMDPMNVNIAESVLRYHIVAIIALIVSMIWQLNFITMKMNYEGSAGTFEKVCKYALLFFVFYLFD
jgi:hypothetical protein